MDIEIDVDAVQRKYALERAKRLRSITRDPYPELKGKFADFEMIRTSVPDSAASRWSNWSMW